MRSKNVVDLRGGRPAPRRRAAACARVRVADATARTSPLREKRRRAMFAFLAAVIVLVAVVILELSYASYLPRYTVNAFTVEGARAMPVRLVSQYIDTQLNTGSRPFISPDNVLLFKTAALERNIAGFFPRIKSAKVSRTSLLATAIVVSIQERQEFALWCSHPEHLGFVNPNLDLRNPNFASAIAGCYSMDDGGFIFAQTDATAAATSTRKYIFSAGLSTSTNPIGNSFAPGHLPGILALFGQLQQMNLTPTGALVDDNGEDFTVPLTEGFAINASFGQDVDALARNIQLILSSDVLQGRQGDIQYIDLRFGDRAYYKLKSNATAGRQGTTTAATTAAY